MIKKDSLLSPDLLDFWIAEQYNVLLIGESGIGKTSIIKSAFEKNNLRWKYFSAPTMDPWVDFIGVPKETEDKNTGKVYLDLIRPKEWEDDEVDAIFIDEFNRAPSKVRNAIMELIQFKSINGKKFKNLKVIWAAINPHDSENPEAYDVEPLDPSQEDRFQIHYKIPYACDFAYFEKSFSKEIAENAIEWWNQLPRNTKYKISPRRLEVAINYVIKNGNPLHVLPEEINAEDFKLIIKNAQIDSIALDIFQNKNQAKAKDLTGDKNNMKYLINVFQNRPELLKFFAPHFHPEELSMMMQKNPGFRKYIQASSERNQNLVKDFENNKSIFKNQIQKMRQEKMDEFDKKIWSQSNFVPAFEKSPEIKNFIENTYIKNIPKKDGQTLSGDYRKINEITYQRYIRSIADGANFDAKKFDVRKKRKIISDMSEFLCNLPNAYASQDMIIKTLLILELCFVSSRLSSFDHQKNDLEKLFAKILKVKKEKNQNGDDKIKFPKMKKFYFTNSELARSGVSLQGEDFSEFVVQYDKI